MQHSVHFVEKKPKEGLGEGGKSSMLTIKETFLIINSIIAIVVAIAYVYVSCDWFESNSEAFDWCDSSSESIGIVLHWAVCILFCAQSFTFIRLFSRKLSGLLSMKCGVLLIAEGIVLKVLETLYDDWSSDDMSIVLFRIFGRTYCNVIGITVFMGILLVASGAAMAKLKLRD